MPRKDPIARAAYERARRRDLEYKKRMYKWRKDYRAREIAKFGQRQDYARIKASPERYADLLRKRCQYRFDLRAKALRMYGGVCACCKESESMFLAFDHINGGGSKERIELGIVKQVAFLRWLIKTGKRRRGIRILCHNCNHATRFGQTCPHRQ